MAQMPGEIKIKIIGIGSNKVGLKILVFVAWLFKINLEVKEV